MGVTSEELRDVEIRSELRGYDRDEVNDLLEHAAAAIASPSEQLAQMQERLSHARAQGFSS